jgi:hypothetical protein
VFRELLQNSDDAGARSAEIRFETEEYLSREKGDDPQTDEPKHEDLPDLKTAVACGFLCADLMGVSLLYSTITRTGAPMDVQEQRYTIQRRGLESTQEDWCLNFPIYRSHLLIFP